MSQFIKGERALSIVNDAARDYSAMANLDFDICEYEVEKQLIEFNEWMDIHNELRAQGCCPICQTVCNSPCCDECKKDPLVYELDGEWFHKDIFGDMR